MIYITKQSPPREMVRKVSEIKSSPEWKSIQEGNTAAVRAAFDKLPKEAIRQSLLEEQHYLCAYCMRPIRNDGQITSIEHWYPLSKDKEKALDYGNMLAVCDGGQKVQGEGKKVLCCDAFKSDEDGMTISPLNSAQMSVIAYDSIGFIKTKPENKALDDEINEKLRLNGIRKDGKLIADTSTGLVKGRKDAYESVRKYVTKLGKNGKCTSSQIKHKIDEIKNAEQRQAYAGVMLFYLNNKYNSLVRQGK